MIFFRKKKESVKEVDDLQKKVAVELSHHEEVREKTIKSTTEVGKKFVKTVVQNGFTLRIHVAAGGKR